MLMRYFQIVDMHILIYTNLACVPLNSTQSKFMRSLNYLNTQKKCKRMLIEITKNVRRKGLFTY